MEFNLKNIKEAVVATVAISGTITAVVALRKAQRNQNITNLLAKSKGLSDDEIKLARKTSKKSYKKAVQEAKSNLKEKKAEATATVVEATEEVKKAEKQVKEVSKDAEIADQMDKAKKKAGAKS